MCKTAEQSILNVKHVYSHPSSYLVILYCMHTTSISNIQKWFTNVPDKRSINANMHSIFLFNKTDIILTYIAKINVRKALWTWTFQLYTTKYFDKKGTIIKTNYIVLNNRLLVVHIPVIEFLQISVLKSILSPIAYNSALYMICQCNKIC